MEQFTKQRLAEKPAEQKPVLPLTEQLDQLAAEIDSDIIKDLLHSEYGKIYRAYIKNRKFTDPHVEEIVKEMLGKKYAERYSVDHSEFIKDPYKGVRDKLLGKAKDIVLALAKEGMPEAVFVCCIKIYNREILSKIYGNLVSLFGNGEASILYTPGMPTGKDQKEIAEYEEKYRRWKGLRQNVIFGGPYSDLTLKRIEDKLLPIATEDIWDYLDKFYSDMDQIIPDSDRQRFKELYLKMHPPENLESAGENNTKNSFKPETSDKDPLKKPIKDLRKELEKYGNEETGFEKIILRKNKSSGKYLFVCTVYLFRDIKNRNPSLEETAVASLLNADLDSISKLFEALTLSEVKFVVDEMSRIQITAPWENYLLQRFMKAFRSKSDEVSYLLGLLEPAGVLSKLASDQAFWNGLDPSDMEYLAERLWNGLERKKFYDFLYECIEAQKENGGIVNLLRRLLIKLWIKHGSGYIELYDAYRRLTRLFSDGEFAKYSIPVEIIECASSLVSEKNQTISALRANEVNIKKELYLQFSGAVKEIEKVEILTAQLLEHETAGQEIFAYQLTEAVMNLRKALDYIGLSPAESIESFSSRAEIPFDEQKHKVKPGVTVRSKQKVRLMSLGLKNNEYKIHYKAAVSLNNNSTKRG